MEKRWLKQLRFDCRFEDICDVAICYAIVINNVVIAQFVAWDIYLMHISWHILMTVFTCVVLLCVTFNIAGGD